MVWKCTVQYLLSQTAILFLVSMFNFREVNKNKTWTHVGSLHLFVLLAAALRLRFDCQNLVNLKVRSSKITPKALRSHINALPIKIRLNEQHHAKKEPPTTPEKPYKKGPKISRFIVVSKPKTLSCKRRPNRLNPKWWLKSTTIGPGKMMTATNGE